MNRLFDEILADLNAKKTLIETAINGMNAIQELFDDHLQAPFFQRLPLPTPPVVAAAVEQKPEPVVEPKADPAPPQEALKPAPVRPGRKKTAPHCAKHPENTLFYANRRCKLCEREYQAGRYEDKKTSKQKRAAANAAPTPQSPLQKRCQACKQLRSYDDFGEGPERAKRRCKFCEAGDVTEKECAVCHKSKPISEFDKFAGRPLGHPDCKECRSNSSSQLYRSNGNGKGRGRPRRFPKPQSTPGAYAIGAAAPPLGDDDDELDDESGEPSDADLESLEVETEPETEPPAETLEDAFESIGRKAKAAQDGRRDEKPGEFIYSKKLTCPKCGAGNIRLKRKSTTDPLKDYWIHARGAQPACTIKISHYNIRTDGAYQPQEVMA